MEISLQGVGKCYGALWAVKDLSMFIPSGKITAFLGPNGAGKTTTIKMLTGLLKPSHGQILYDGSDFQHNPVFLKKQMAYVPDFPFLYDRLTGGEFLEFIAGIYEIPLDIRKQRIQEFLDRFELFPMKNKLVRQYSHGMRQRLVFCAALMRYPRVLIIDEPMVGLDPKTTRIFKDLLIELSSEGVTIFLSTHQLTVAEELADQISIIHHGQLLRTGSLNELQKAQKSEQNLEHLFLSLTEGG